MDDGWLDKFKRRNNIVFRSVQAEAGDIRPEQTDTRYNEELPALALLERYKPEDIFNTDEFGLSYYQTKPFFKTLPIRYEANRKAWMTSDLFEKWVRELDAKMTRQNRRILLVLDNCPAHPQIGNLLAIRLAFLPPNTTAHTQPLDQAIIQALKLHYRKLILQKLLSSYDAQQ